MVHRQISSNLQKTLATGKSILLLGPRQTGKTTLLKGIPHDRYIALAKPRVRLEYEKDPSRLGREVQSLAEQLKTRRPPLVIIDEIQKVPALMDEIQDLIDNKIARFILTGSSARKLKRSGELNLLPGRVIALKMDPLSIPELRSRSIEDHLLYGDLPEVALEKEKPQRSELLRSYVEIYLDEEVKAEALVRGLGPFARFLELAAIEAGRIVNFSSISQEIGSSIHTIANYYEVLIDCLVAERIEPLTQSASRKKLTRSPKILFFDMGVRRLAAREGIGLLPERMGELFEQWIGLEILRMNRSRSPAVHLKFWRDPDGPEVDWVIDWGDRFTPIEVKWTENPQPRHAKHLETFMSEYPNATPGFVVSRVRTQQRLTKHVTAISWQQLWEELKKLAP